MTVWTYFTYNIKEYLECSNDYEDHDQPDSTSDPADHIASNQL